MKNALQNGQNPPDIQPEITPLPHPDPDNAQPTKSVKADPGEFKASVLESTRRLEDGRDD